MNLTFPEPWCTRLQSTGAVAVVIIDEPRHAEPLAAALLEGGIDLIELTLRTPSALEGIRRIRQAFPTVGIGAGTLLEPAQVQAAVEAGATFGVAPGLNPDVVRAARDCGLPFAPGVCTPSEIERALGLGCGLLKYFPAETLGGARHLRITTSPFSHLGVRYMPLGGITLQTAESYLREPSVIALGGSWIAPRELITGGNWGLIRENARAVREMVDNLRKPRST
jgi:2-dehydro-3-deoxyphosphogluconate aldolase/(4S)-4-hydroxy-2-oxoglutarate aldolase